MRLVPLLGCWVVGGWALSCAFVPTARAQGTLGWDAPAGCPRVEVLTARVEALALSPVIGAPMSATVVRDGGDFIASIHGETDEVRELRAHSCETLTAAVALVMATAMTEASPARSSTGSVERAVEEVDPDGEPTPALTSARGSDGEEAAPEDPLRLVVSATSGAVLGLAGGAEALIAASLGLRADGFEVALGGSRVFRIDEPDTDTTRATLRLGWVMRWAPFEVAFRVLGDVYTSFRGPANARSGGLWAMIGAGVELRLWIEDAAAVTLSFDGTIPVSRSPVHLEGPRPLDDLPTLASVVTGGIFFPLQ